MFGGRGYYIALALCLAAVGTIGYFALRERPVTVKQQEPAPTLDIQPAPTQPVVKPAPVVIPEPEPQPEINEPAELLPQVVSPLDGTTVTVAFGVRNFDGLDRGLQEMQRVLKPSGRLVILELSTPTTFPMKQLYRFYSKTVMPLIGRLVSKDTSAYTYLPERIAACPQGEEMAAIIGKAGFSEVKYETLTFGICTLYTGIK